MDARSDVSRVTHLTGGVFLHEFTAPWCMAARVAPEHCRQAFGPASHFVPFHYVVEGSPSARLEEEGEAAFMLQEEDVVLLPRNDLHRMGSDLSVLPGMGSDIIQPPKHDGWYSMRHGGGGMRTRMVCDFLGCDRAEGNPVLLILPPALKLNFEKGEPAEWIRSTFQYAAEEVADGRPGSNTVLAKLSELLFVEAVRRYAETLPEGQTGWLAGLRDTHLTRALALIHGDVARPWTVDELGRGGELVAFGASRPFYPPDRHAADALSCELAHAGCDAKASEHHRIARPGDQYGRL